MLSLTYNSIYFENTEILAGRREGGDSFDSHVVPDMSWRDMVYKLTSMKG